MRLILIALVFVLAPLTANAYEAPFGFRWGMSLAEVKALVGIFEMKNASSGQPGITSAAFLKAPKTPARTAAFAAVFSSDKGLIKLAWLSDVIKGSNDGKAQAAFFDQLQRILEDNYPTGESNVQDFGRSKWFTKKPNTGGSIALNMKLGKYKSDPGEVTITYESPDFEAEIEAAKKRGVLEVEKDKKAF